MKTEKETKEKIKQLEEYLKKGVPMSNLYPLDKTESFIGGLRWVLDEEED